MSALPPDYEQRVPSGITSVSHHHHHRNYNESSGFPVATYPKHKSYLTSTLISIPKSCSASSSYYVSAPPPTAIQEIPCRYNLDSNMPPVASATAYIPPMENVSTDLIMFHNKKQSNRVFVLYILGSIESVDEQLNI